MRLVVSDEREQLALPPDAREGAPVDGAGTPAIERGQMLDGRVALVAAAAGLRKARGLRRLKYAGRRAHRARHWSTPRFVDARHPPDTGPPGLSLVAVRRRRERHRRMGLTIRWWWWEPGACASP